MRRSIWLCLAVLAASPPSSGSCAVGGYLAIEEPASLPGPEMEGKPYVNQVSGFLDDVVSRMRDEAPGAKLYGATLIFGNWVFTFFEPKEKRLIVASYGARGLEDRKTCWPGAKGWSTCTRDYLVDGKWLRDVRDEPAQDWVGLASQCSQLDLEFSGTADLQRTLRKMRVEFASDEAGHTRDGALLLFRPKASRQRCDGPLSWYTGYGTWRPRCPRALSGLQLWAVNTEEELLCFDAKTYRLLYRGPGEEEDPGPRVKRVAAPPRRRT